VVLPKDGVPKRRRSLRRRLQQDEEHQHATMDQPSNAAAPAGRDGHADNDTRKTGSRSREQQRSVFQETSSTQGQQLK